MMGRTTCGINTHSFPPALTALCSEPSAFGDCGAESFDPLMYRPVAGRVYIECVMSLDVNYGRTNQEQEAQSRRFESKRCIFGSCQWKRFCHRLDDLSSVRPSFSKEICIGKRNIISFTGGSHTLETWQDGGEETAENA